MKISRIATSTAALLTIIAGGVFAGNVIAASGNAPMVIAASDATQIEERQRYEAEVAGELAAVEAQMNQLQGSKKNDESALPEYEVLDDAWIALQEQWDSTKQTVGEGWDDAKKSFDENFEALKKKISDMTSE